MLLLSDIIKKYVNKRFVLLICISIFFFFITSFISKMMFVPYPRELVFTDLFNPLIIYAPIFCILTCFDNICLISILALLLIIFLLILLLYSFYNYVKLGYNRFIICYLTILCMWNITGFCVYAVFYVMSSV